MKDQDTTLATPTTTDTAAPVPAKPLKLKAICGANQVELEDMSGYTVNQLRREMKEVLNLGDEQIVLVNGRPVTGDQFLAGNEEVEFKKEAGEKG